MKHFFRIATILTTGLLAVAFFFRLSVLSGFEYVPGDIWDGRLIFGIVDHWRQFYSGQCAWNDLRIFWPLENTLAYSDAFFIEGVPYTILCALGVEQLVAYTLVLMGQAFVGYLSMYWLLKRFLKVQWWLAAAFAAIFVNLASMQLSIDSSHLQMTIAWLAPLFVTLVWKALEGGKRASLWAAGAAALLSAMFFSAYYMTWFMTFFLCIVAGLWFVSRLIFPARNAACHGFKDKCRALACWLLEKWKPIATFTVTFAITIIPFLMLYLPAVGQFGKRTFTEVLLTLPGPIDFVNVGERNHFWGWAGEIYRLDKRPYGGELNFGIPPITFLFFLIAFAFLLVLAFRKQKLAKEERIALVAGCAVLISWILLLRINQDSAWYFVLNYIPGAGAMRSIFRMNLILASASLVVSAVFIKRYLGGKGIGCALVSALAVVIFLEQNATPRTDSRIERSVENARMAMIPPPPPDARIFFMAPDIKGGRPDMLQEHITALLVAGRYNLHTINGYSGQLPSGWNPTIEGDRYFRYMGGWRASHGDPDNVYGLDAARGLWLMQDFVPPPVEYMPNAEVIDGKVFDKYAWTGWSGIEQWGVWSNSTHAEFRFLASDKNRDLIVKIAFHSFNPNGRKQRVSIFVNKREAGNWTVGEDEHPKIEIRVPASEIEGGKLQVSFELPDAISPQSVGKGSDPRVLGVGLDSFVISPAE